VGPLFLHHQQKISTVHAKSRHMPALASPTSRSCPPTCTGPSSATRAMHSRTRKRYVQSSCCNGATPILARAVSSWFQVCHASLPVLCPRSSTHCMPPTPCQLEGCQRLTCIGVGGLVPFAPGTPILSRPLDLYSQLEILRPGLLGSYYQYGLRYCTSDYFREQEFRSGAPNRPTMHQYAGEVRGTPGGWLMRSACVGRGWAHAAAWNRCLQRRTSCGVT
jgi:hypothetical protein